MTAPEWLWWLVVVLSAGALAWWLFSRAGRAPERDEDGGMF